MVRRTRVWLNLFATLALLAPGVARSETPTARPGELLVKYRPTTRIVERAAARSENRVTLLRRFPRFDVDLVRVEGQTTDQALAALSSDPRVLYAEPNWEYHLDAVPDDARYIDLWGLHNTGQNGGLVGADIRAERAWDLFTGDPELKIGVIDTGVDYEHADLVANMWTNPGEIPDNGIDDDGNGYKDDIHGWDAYHEDGDPWDDHGHGTHTAGTIAAVGGNGMGVTGVCWRAKIVAIKFLNNNGSGSSAEALGAVEYAIAAGVRLTSNSWGGGAYSQALLDAINTAGQAGQLFIAAAGNASSDNDQRPVYPASYSSPYIVSVASTDNRDKLSTFSNYGANSVDLAAPGTSILSLAAGGGYRFLSGTSMATPHVAGVVALAMGLYPVATNLTIRQQLLASVDTLPGLAGKVKTGGRLNAFVTIAEPDSTTPGRIADLRIVGSTSNGFFLEWTATGDDGDRGRAVSMELKWALAPIVDEAGWDAAHPITPPVPQVSGTAQSFEARGLTYSTTYWLAMKVLDEFGNTGPVSNTVSGTTLDPPEVEIAPASISAEILVNAEILRTITLRNTGSGTLDFQIPTPELAYGASPPLAPIPTPKDAPDTRVGPPVTQGRGGPDEFGYRWVDSREPGGPAFEWQDIREVGTRVPLIGDEASTSAIPIGFTFPFYGNNFTLLRITTNGYVSFTETNSQYDNQPLPSTGAPQNLVAPFWDDLFVGPFSNVYVFTDGTRCIVTWDNVTAFPAGGPYTFQMILDPTGEIRFQYLSMGDPRFSCTVGLQNATRQIGLTAVFNNAFIESGLAVRFVPTQQWLTVTPESGRVQPGQSLDLTAKLSAFALSGGNYEASLRLLTNDPDEDTTLVPVDLRVIGAPDLQSLPATLDFGTVYVGQRATRTLTVTNVGSDRLEISSITPTDPDVTITPSSLVVNPREVKYLTVACLPTSVHDLTGGLVVQCNEPGEPTRTIPVVGACRNAPDVRIEPDSLYVPISSEQVLHRSLRVTNSGGSEFVFTASASRVTGAAGESPQRVAQVARAQSPTVDPRTSRSGGPDHFGYTYRDSDELGGPTFEWVDIRGTGTQLNLLGEDGNVGPLPVGFDFPFYGNTFSTFRVCLNGWISFTNSSSGRENFPLPSAITTAPENVIAMYWDDLAFGLARRAWYRNDGTRLIVQFESVFRSGETSSYGNTFQALLYPNGSIVLQYKQLQAINNASHTVGTQNATRDDGLQIAFNETYLHDSLAIRIQPPVPFVAVAPASGSVPPGGFVDLDVTLDATQLFGGSYLGEIRVTGNDASIPAQVVRARLDVTGSPRIVFAPSGLDFGTVFAGFPRVRPLRITNFGTDVLQVSNITVDDPAYTFDRTQFTVEPLGSTELFVTLGSLEPGDHPATLTLRSNDPEESRSRATLVGRVVDAPALEMSASSITGTLAIPNHETRTLTLRNAGGSDLQFSIATLFDLPAAGSPRPVSELDGAEPAPVTEAGSGDPTNHARGGPDAYGYHWRDSDQIGGPAFEWIDIQALGTPVAFTGRGDDENAREIPLGFDFPFYGVVHRTLNVCSNGWASFTNTAVSSANQPLPSSGSGAPENLLAVFWDDLNPGNSAVRVWTWTDGNRFVVSWIGVLRTGSGGPYTFQAVLEPSGRIVYQYRAMRGPRLNEATIGIQNGTRDIGLTVVSDAFYVADSLAVEFLPLPEYVRVAPESGTVPPGGSADLTVTLDSEGLFGATYRGAVRVITNDPNLETVTLPVELHTHGVPDIAPVPQVVAFDPIYAAAHQDRRVQLLNPGTDSLHVTSIAVSSPAFVVIDAPALPVTIGPRYPVEFTVRFAPSAPCECTGYLVIGSDDPDEASYPLPLVGRALPAPELDGLPAGLTASLAPSIGIGTGTRPVILRNTGGSDLDWNAFAYSMLPSRAPAPPPVDDVAVAVQLEKGVDGEPGGASVQSAGGPDAFGYQWSDSDEPMGVPFHWEDITTIGTRLPFELDDQTLGPIPLPFHFPFYGQIFDSIRVCSNGWLSFTSDRNNYTNVALPSAAPGIPENLIAPFWEDLTYNVDRGSAFIHYDDEKLIFSFHQVRRFGGDAFVTFQVLLYPSGTIDFQYLLMNGRTDNATIGIQNGARNIGLQMAFNTQYVKNGLRTRIAPRGGWLSVTPKSGRLAAGASDTLQVGFDAGPFGDGDYAGLLRVASNDVDEPSIEVPCAMHVGTVTGGFDLEDRVVRRGRDWTRARVRAPQGVELGALRISSFRVQREVPVLLEGIHMNPHGLDVRFGTDALLAVLPDGAGVPVELIGEIDGGGWFVATDTVRVIGGQGVQALSGTAALPVEFGLQLQGGNPVRGDARLELALPVAGTADVRVFDVRGRVVKRLTSGPLEAGRHVVGWNGNDASGAPSAPGVYFVRATMPSQPARVVRVVKLQ